MISFEVLIPLWVALGVLAGAGVAALEKWALHRSILDIPNARSSHDRPTPRGGGLAVIIAIALGWVAVELWVIPSGLPWALPAAVALVAGISWLDDLRGVSNKMRFLTHALAAAVVLWNIGYWTQFALPGIGTVSLGLLGAVVSLVWILGLTNAYNFMDGIDGIAGWQAVVAGLGWMYIGVVINSPWTIATGGIVAAATGAFLLFNWSPARIFMGDVGSAPIGFLFAALPFVAMTRATPEMAMRLPVAAVLLVWPFVFDSVFTFIRRLRNGENVFAAHRSHLYQRLTIANWSHRSVSTLFAGLGAVGFLAAAAWLTGPFLLGTFAVALIIVAAVSLVLGVERVEKSYDEEVMREHRERREARRRSATSSYSGDGGMTDQPVPVEEEEALVADAQR